MSLRKFIIIAIASVSVIAGPASAVDADAPSSEQIAERFEAAKQRLKLTEEQAPQVEAVLRDSAEKRRAVLEKYDVGGDKKLSFRELRALRSELEPISEQTRASLSSILTPEQLSEFEAMQQEQRAEMRAKLQARRG